MANRSLTIPKAHLIMALCLPLAILLGYFLAEPMDSSSMAIVTFVLVILAVPLMMKWHHPLLVLSWNAYVAPVFLPGQPFLWMLLAPTALLFAMLNRAVNPDRPFISPPSITRPLLFFFAVIVITAWLTGGLGFRSLGASVYGGRNYFYLVVAIAGYFALTSHPIPPEKAPLYAAMFFLPALTALIPHLVYALGASAYFLFRIFPSSVVMEQARGTASLGLDIIRINGLNLAAPGLYCFLFARFGIRGLCELRKPWRMTLFLLAAFGCAYSGFRSTLILFLCNFIAQFFFEGLHRTRLLPVLLGCTLVLGVIMIPVAEKLPLVIQRTISFLPLKVSPIAERSASGSTEWRVNIWKTVLPEIPKYLLKGKGYAMDPQAMFLESESARRGEDPSFGIQLVGDYHNGPLSVIMPFGIFGVIGFVWFIAASIRLLLRNWRCSDPRLKLINTFLLAAFVARIVFFCFVFGGLYSELFIFTGLVGLSVSLNGQPKPQTDEQPSEEEALEAFS